MSFELSPKELKMLQKLLIHGVSAVFDSPEFGDAYPTIEFPFMKEEKDEMLSNLHFLKTLETRALQCEAEKRNKKSSTQNSQ